ncbi:MAG: lamin tail domain-containing protein, partial [Chloroflexota bacterium]
LSARVSLLCVGFSLLIASSIMACVPTTPTTSTTKPNAQPPTQIENETPPESSQPELPPEETENEADWNIVQTFTGQESENTPSFHISGTKWRIIWTADIKYPEYAIFDILVYPQDTTSLLTKRISYSKGTSGDTAYIYEGGRDYYLKVIAANLSNWTITVEDYANQELNCPVQITKINHKGAEYLRQIAGGYVIIVEADEYVEIRNLSDSPQNITGWALTNLTKGGPSYTFPTFKPCSCEWYSSHTDCIKNCYPPRPCVIEPYKSIRVYTHEPHYESGGFCFYYGVNIWDNEMPDTAVLYNLEGQEVSRKSYVTH